MRRLALALALAAAAPGAAEPSPTRFAYAGELTQGGWLKGSVPAGTAALTLDGVPVDIAPADGVVILAAEAPFTLEGNLLMIDHGNGLNSAFLHSAKLLVQTGDIVRRGQAIGTIGMTGRATGPHLHWSVKWHEARLDPILFTGPMRPH